MNMEMITQCLLMINVAAMVAIFVYSACSFSVRQWTEIMFNVAAASYFVMRSRRIHLLAGILQRKGKGYLKERRETK